MTGPRLAAVLVGVIMVGAAFTLAGTARAAGPTIICCGGGGGGGGGGSSPPTWYNVSTGNWAGIEVASGGLTSYGGEVYIPSISQLSCPLQPGATNTICALSFFVGEGGDPGFLSNGQEYPLWQAGVVITIPHTCNAPAYADYDISLFTFGMSSSGDSESVPTIGTATYGCAGSMTLGSVNFGEWLTVDLSNNHNTGVASANFYDNEGNWFGTNSNLTHDTYRNGEMIAESFAFQSLYTALPVSSGFQFSNLPIPSGTTQIGMLTAYVDDVVTGCFYPTVPSSGSFTVYYSSSCT